MLSISIRLEHCRKNLSQIIHHEQQQLNATRLNVRLASEVVPGAFGDQQHFVEEEGVAQRLGAANAERALGAQLAKGGEISALPVVQEALDFLDAHGVLVAPLHLVDVLREASHGAERLLDVCPASRLRGELLHQTLQQQVVLEHSLHRLQQVRAQRQ
jgi:hypothetical protein